jgi:capsular exopolysaccharide synthesis family protein
MNELTKQNSDMQTESAVAAFTANVQQTDLRLRPESRIFGQGEDSALGIEQYRLLLGRLLHLQTKMPIKRLLVTSAGRAEGKTNICANLAITIARETDKKVLLVDADLRKPDLHRIYGVPNEYGVTDVLKNGHDLSKAIRKVRGMNLFLLTAGTAESQPLTTSSILTLKMILDQMNAAFDWVLIDTPPVLVAADTPLLAKLADGVLFVVGAAETPRDMVIKAKDLLETVPIVGAVLNRHNPVSANYAAYARTAYGESPRGKAVLEKGKLTQRPKGILT